MYNSISIVINYVYYFLFFLRKYTADFPIYATTRVIFCRDIQPQFTNTMVHARFW